MITVAGVEVGPGDCLLVSGDSQSEVLASLGVPYVSVLASLPDEVVVQDVSTDPRFVPTLLSLRFAEEDLGKQGFMLSRGTRQKVVLAQALLQPLLVVDEPLAGLDGPARAALVAVLAGYLAAGGAAVIAAWDLGDLEPLVTRRVEV